jgi:hypothetical protein
VRLEAHGSYAHGIGDPDLQFVYADALLEGGLEVLHPDRVLTLSVYAAQAWALGIAPVPFTHLPTLGLYQQQGYVYGRFVDQSAVVAELDYRYPIWQYLDALLLASTGNVFGTNFAGFDPRLFTACFGLGVRTRFAGRDALEALVAVGTKRFDEPFGIEGVRLYVGINPGL